MSSAVTVARVILAGLASTLASHSVLSAQAFTGTITVFIYEICMWSTKVKTTVQLF